MQIVSFRGPAQPGGVSSLIHKAQHRSQSTWWHLHGGLLQTLSSHKLTPIASIPSPIIDGHYSYANEFLWPVMHGRSDIAHHVQSDHDSYKSLNMAFAANLNRWSGDQSLFIHDYQFALMPEYLSRDKASRSVFFWHIPWPSSCPRSAQLQLVESCRAMLLCKAIGFHTEEYVNNFCSFIREFVPEVKVSNDNTIIIHRCGRHTELIVSPAGIDYSAWSHAARTSIAPPPSELPYILSVDRADYTKGISERIDAIASVFRARPDLKGNIQFVFVCQPTRVGIKAFDKYWSECRSKYQSALAELASDAWSPIVWISEPQTPEVLATWYSRAQSMLVTPNRDGLNLTAKEFVASSVNLHASLILSRGAGVWHELKDNVITISACTPEDISQAILKALQSPPARRCANLEALKSSVRANSLDRWWHHLTGQASPTAVIPRTRVYA